MILSGGNLSPEVRALLGRERAIAAQPAVVRARALARARATSMAMSASKPVAAPASAATPSRRRWAAAAAILCVLGAGVGAAAYQIRVRRMPLPSNRVADPTIVRPPAAAVVAPSFPPIANPIDDSPATPVRAMVPRSKIEATQEQEQLRLLREARAAVARNDFAAALPLLAEHARRFKDGSLAEEREALRVKALAGLDRLDEARRAAAAFGARFPRSVLLQAVNQMAMPRAP